MNTKEIVKVSGFEFCEWASNSVELRSKINREESINYTNSSNKSNHTRNGFWYKLGFKSWYNYSWFSWISKWIIFVTYDQKIYFKDKCEDIWLTWTYMTNYKTIRNVISNNMYKKINWGDYSCSFVAKLRWKKRGFLSFTKYTLFAEKIFFYVKKVLYWKVFVLKKAFFTEKYVYENVKNVYLIWEIFFLQKIFVLP